MRVISMGEITLQVAASNNHPLVLNYLSQQALSTNIPTLIKMTSAQILSHPFVSTDIEQTLSDNFYLTVAQ